MVRAILFLVTFAIVTNSPHVLAGAGKNAKGSDRSKRNRRTHSGHGKKQHGLGSTQRDRGKSQFGRGDKSRDRGKSQFGRGRVNDHGKARRHGKGSHQAAHRAKAHRAKQQAAARRRAAHRRKHAAQHRHKNNGPTTASQKNAQARLKEALEGLKAQGLPADLNPSRLSANSDLTMEQAMMIAARIKRMREVAQKQQGTHGSKASARKKSQSNARRKAAKARSKARDHARKHAKRHSKNVARDRAQRTRKAKPSPRPAKR